MILNTAALLLSLAWGLLIFTLSWLTWQSSPNGTKVTPLRKLLQTPYMRKVSLYEHSVTFFTCLVPPGLLIQILSLHGFNGRQVW